MNKLVTVPSNGYAEASEDSHCEKAESDSLAEGSDLLSTRLAVAAARRAA